MEIFEKYFCRNAFQPLWIDDVVKPFVKDCGEAGKTWINKQRLRLTNSGKKATFYVCHLVCTELQGCPVKLRITMSSRPTVDEPARLTCIKTGSHTHESVFSERPRTLWEHSALEARQEALINFEKSCGPTDTYETIEARFGEAAPSLSAMRMAHSRYRCKEDLDKDEVRDLLLQEEIWRTEISPSSSLPGYIQVSVL